MRRWISFFLLLVLLTISLPVTFAAALPHVVDEANLLTSHELQSLSQQAETIGDRYQVDVVILTVVSLEGKDPESYADDYYDQRGYGLGSDRSGILLLISTESRDWAISTCGQAITWVTDQDLERLEKALLPSLAQNRYSTAFQNYLQALDQILSAPLPEKTTFTWELVLRTLLWSLLLGGLGRWRRSADPAAADAYRAAPAVRRGLRSPRQLSADPAAGHLFVQPYHPGQAANHTKWRQLPWRRLLHPPQQQRLQSRREPRKILM